MLLPLAEGASFSTNLAGIVVTVTGLLIVLAWLAHLYGDAPRGS